MPAVVHAGVQQERVGAYFELPETEFSLTGLFALCLGRSATVMTALRQSRRHCGSRHEPTGDYRGTDA